ncbi:hypothetical protein BC936DRAFT_143949 [Jimgerdemannia flammicorona]|uniref:Methyltransferase domain-containing protein n=1 Tax=Jimgerdemannia flammicorona TaxID=994334 RepID=A0A433DM77_9FUNG|nr:hypothetical protein BC936DRAFT_143949 [Jimgerdemannia flammicorona]
MAEDYPQSTFVGIDISENFPKVGNILPNCTFLKANKLEGLPLPMESSATSSNDSWSRHSRHRIGRLPFANSHGSLNPVDGWS